jgi:hypothetical protein
MKFREILEGIGMFVSAIAVMAFIFLWGVRSCKRKEPSVIHNYVTQEKEQRFTRNT